VIAAAIGALPLITKSARAALEEVDPRLVGAARSLGAGALRAFFTVSLPLARGGVAAGVTLGFARALGDFGVTLMVAGSIPGVTRTASLAIYDLVQAGREGEALGTALLLSALAIAALYGVNRSNRGRVRV
jgi:molybdate transport system permease protein